MSSIDTLIASYHDQGFVTLEGVLSPEELLALQQRMSDVASGDAEFPLELIEFEPGADRVPRKINRCAENDDIFMTHAMNPRILDVVEQLIGPDIKLYSSQCFMKPPGGVEKPWHQDSAYFTIAPRALVTCWTALDAVTIDNGCLWVIPGSHKGELYDHRQPWQVGDRVDMQVPEGDFNNRQEASIVMPAGSCSFHHSMLLHRSGANQTDQPRRGLAVHYVASRSRWTDPAQPQPEFQLLRGREYEGCV